MTIRNQTELAAGQRLCDVGLVFALAMEAGGLEDRMSGMLAIKGPPFRVRQGSVRGRHVVLVVSGPGRAAATRATEMLIAGHRPRLVVSAGFAGGLNAMVARGDIVMADSVADENGKRLAIEFKIDHRGLDPQGVRVGRVLTVDRIVHRSDEKRALGQQHEALAVDMESLAVAEVCQREQTPCIVVRAISDGVDDELPRDIERLLHAKTVTRRLGIVTGTLFRRPSSWKDLWQMREDALVASDRLAKFLEGLIGQLPS